jgi:hypothetical protein
MEARLELVPMAALLDVSLIEGSGSPTAGLGEQARSSSEKTAKMNRALFHSYGHLRTSRLACG